MWRTLHIHEYNFTFNFYKLTQWWVYKKAMAEGVYEGTSLYPIIIKTGQNILGILKGRKICISEGMKYRIALDREREKHHRSATTKASWNFKVGERIFIGKIRKIFLEGVVAKMSFDKLGFGSLSLSINVTHRENSNNKAKNAWACSGDSKYERKPSRNAVIAMDWIFSLKINMLKPSPSNATIFSNGGI